MWGQTRWNYLYHESALRNKQLTKKQKDHILALKRAGAVSYETLEKKYNECENDTCRNEIKQQWYQESEKTKQIQLELVKQGVLTWEDFDSYANGGYIGINSTHLTTIQNKQHTLAAMELSSWAQNQNTPARTEALRRDGGVTPGSTEDLLMQVGAGTVGGMVAGRWQRGNGVATPATNQSTISSSNIVVYNPQYATKQVLNGGRINESDLRKLVPQGATDIFVSSESIRQGYKYEFYANGTKVQIKWHSPDQQAALKYPNSNSGRMWTAQIKVGNKYLGSDGNFYRNPQQNITHIPVNIGK